MSLVSEILDRIPQRPLRLVSVTCVTVSPPTFYVDGDSTTPLPCAIQSGSVFTTGQSGMAYWAAPSLPICFKTN